VRFPEGWELVLIVLVILVLFGYKKLPDATRSIGRSMRIFKSEVKGLKNDDVTAPPPPVRTTVAEVDPTLPPVAPVAPVTPPAPAAAPVVEPGSQQPAPHGSAASRQP
jgi:sec-independent protein translocase protein TatA